MVAAPIYAGVQTGMVGRINGWTNITKFTGTFCDCVNAPRKLDYSCSKSILGIKLVQILSFSLNKWEVEYIKTVKCIMHLMHFYVL